MAKSTFKASSTLRLARTFLSKNKVMDTWKAEAEVDNNVKKSDKIVEEPDSVVPTSGAISQNRSPKQSAAASPARSTN